MAKINPKTAKAIYEAGMKANKEKIAQERYGEFGFDTLTYDQQQEVYKNYPKLPKSKKDKASDFETPMDMKKQKNKKVRDTVRINKPSKIYKPGDYVTEDDFEAQFKKIEGDSSTFPQYSVEDYSTIKVDKTGPYVVKESGINMGSPLYGKISSACKAAAKKKFKVWPSAYASGWGVRCTKAGGPGNFGNKKK